MTTCQFANLPTPEGQSVQKDKGDDSRIFKVVTWRPHTILPRSEQRQRNRVYLEPLVNMFGHLRSDTNCETKKTIAMVKEKTVWQIWES